MPGKKWTWNEAEDAFLRRMYDPAISGRSQEIANWLRRPRWVVNRRAVALGLSRPKDRPWCEEDRDYLEANYHRSAMKALTKRLGRSPTAIKLTAKRLGLRKYDEGYTASSLAEALGVDPHWVLSRIRSGKLRAAPRRTERKPEQGGDSWLISDDALLDFLREHSYDIDLHKVDSLWFMDLIGPCLQLVAPAPRQSQAA
jgi:hypothetical protein